MEGPIDSPGPIDGTTLPRPFSQRCTISWVKVYLVMSERGLSIGKMKHASITKVAGEAVRHGGDQSSIPEDRGVFPLLRGLNRGRWLIVYRRWGTPISKTQA